MAREQTFFIGVGAQRAGTTWLWQALRLHPGVWTPPEKELHYFDARFVEGHAAGVAARARSRASTETGPDAAWWRRYAEQRGDDAWYHSLFEAPPAAAAAGEITPAYSLLDAAGFAAVREAIPHAKLIFILRDPVARVLSQLRLHRAYTPYPDVFEHADSLRKLAFSSPILARSRYDLTLAAIESAFPASRLLTLVFEEMFVDAASRRGSLDRVAAFLDLAAFPASASQTEDRINAASAIDVPAALITDLRTALDPVYRDIRRRFGEPPAGWLG